MASEDRVDWKAVSRELAEMHQELGAACVDLEGEAPDPLAGELVPETPDDEMYATEDELTAKRIRRWLWHHRKADWMPVSAGGDQVLFSATIDGAHVVGVGRLEVS